MINDLNFKALSGFTQLRGDDLDELVARLPEIKQSSQEKYNEALTIVCASVAGIAVMAANKACNGRQEIFHDVAMAAMTGIIRATKDYNKSLARFSTYCTWHAIGHAHSEIDRWDSVGGYAAMRSGKKQRESFANFLERFPYRAVSLDGSRFFGESENASDVSGAEQIPGDDMAVAINEINANMTIKLLIKKSRLNKLEMDTLLSILRQEPMSVYAERTGLTRQALAYRRKTLMKKLRDAAKKLGITQLDI